MILHTDNFLCGKIDNDINTFFVDNPDQKFLVYQNLLGCVNSYSSPHFVWTIPWLDWRTLFVELHTDTFLSAKFGNDMGTFSVDKPEKKFVLFKNLLACIHSHSSPNFIWTSPWLDWRTLFLELHTDTFLSAKFGKTLSKFFVGNPHQHFFSISESTEKHALFFSPHFIWTSRWLDWKTPFVMLPTDNFLRAKFDNDVKTFSVDNPDQKFVLFQNMLGCAHSYSSPLFIWTSSWLDWRILFVNLHTDTFLSAKFDNNISNFLLDNPEEKFFLFQCLFWSVHSYSSPRFIWKSSWVDWRTFFVKLHADTSLSAKFDNDISTFFVDKPDKKFLLFQNLLGCVHCYSSPHFFWTISWLDWRTRFVELHTDTFLSAKFGNDMSTFFVDKPDKKFLPFKNLLGCQNSYSSPHSIWTSPGLDWRTHFVKLHTDTFLSAKFDNDMSTFFVDKPEKKFLLFKNLLGCIHSHSSPHFIWTIPWLDWRTLFVELHTDTFLGAKFANNLSKFFLDNPDQKFFHFRTYWERALVFSPHLIWTSPWLDWKTPFVILHTDNFLCSKFDNDKHFFRRQPGSEIHSVSELARMCTLLL